MPDEQPTRVKKARIFKTECGGCGMPLYDATEYHPIVVCWLFEHLRNSDQVRANVAAVMEAGATDDPWLKPRVEKFKEDAHAE